ncbi:hypothetical protein [Streptomyces sp. NPDC053813]|uniref:hypothetical protein n=1 Tax=Streptomyces sp. NPDC053813 TaxID=3365717 RepID=UPI0037D33206
MADDTSGTSGAATEAGSSSASEDERSGGIEVNTAWNAEGVQQVPAQVPVQEAPSVAVARERLVEAIGREAVFLADQRAGQASAGLEALARAFALVAGGAPAAADVASPLPPMGAGRLLPIDQDNLYLAKHSGGPIKLG